MSDNVQITAGSGTTIAADDIGGVLHQRVKLSLGADGTANDASAGAGAVGTGTQRVTLASDDPSVTALAALSQRWGFSVTVAPTVTNGAYSAGDIIGGLLTFSNVARATDELFVVTGVEVNIKAAVTPGLTLVLFDADPNTNAYTDNAAYSIAAADSAKILKAIPISTLFDNGTPNSYSVDGLFVVCPPISGTRNVYGLLVDSVGVTLTSTSDVSIRLRGLGI
jgi:hypothetical protein